MRIARNQKRVSTHMPHLIRCVSETSGDVLEVGAGFYSTALLHWLCQGRKLFTYESDKDYYEYAKKFRNHEHLIRHTADFSDMDFDRRWSLVFIDHTADRGKNPHKRGDDAARFTNADLILMHDTEKPEEYGYDKVFPLYKYRHDWKDREPWTTVVSNTVDVTKWGAN